MPERSNQETPLDVNALAAQVLEEATGQKNDE
jgi:hypothetical protein